MVCSDNSTICFIVIFDYYALTELIARELLPSLLPIQRVGEGACDVTGRDPKSLFIINTALFFNQITQFSLKPLVSNK